MQRQLMTLVAALAFSSAGALAQDGSLAGVTMRVLDDVSDIDAVVLELDAGRAEDAEEAEADGRDAPARDEERSGDAARDEPTQNKRDLSSEPDELHDADDDERNEGRLEDRDVERPAAPQVPAP